MELLLIWCLYKKNRINSFPGDYRFFKIPIMISIGKASGRLANPQALDCLWEP
jgi:hypothetical protein